MVVSRPTPGLWTRLRTALAAPALRAARASGGLLADFRADERGSYITAAALLAPTLAGVMGLGVEYGVWVHRHQTIQSAADSAAMSAAVGYAVNSTDAGAQANAVAASYGFSPDAPDVSITVNRPPLAGSYAGNARAVEVVIAQTLPRMFSALWDATPLTLSARATALTPDANGCTLALNETASGAASAGGSTRVVLNGCSLFVNSTSSSALTVGGSASLFTDAIGVVGGVSGSAGITATNGIATGQSPILDPYINAQVPSFSGCDENNYSTHATETINPGVYCGGIKLTAGAIVTMNPGTYIIDRGDLQVNGGAMLTGTGVTLVFTSSTGNQWPSVTINGNAVVSLTAPKTGPMAGFVVFADRNIPVGTDFKFTGGAMQYLGGAVYAPTAAISYAGGSTSGSSCTQLIGNTLNFTGNSNLAVDCSTFGTKPIGSTSPKIVQ
jgi:Flp pilus assembly protein TadG